MFDAYGNEYLKEALDAESFIALLQLIRRELAENLGRGMDSNEADIRAMVWEKRAWESAAAGGFSKPEQPYATNEAGATEPSEPESIQTEGGPAGSRTRQTQQFPQRALWLRDRLLERGWGNSDPSNYRGPDRKTIEKILRGESVRNDILEKLAEALSQKCAKVSVFEIPQS